MSTDQTAEEFAESLTGWEEIAISKKFGKDSFGDLPGTMGARAMVFTDLVRGGDSADAAYQRALDIPLGELNSYFKDDDEVTPQDPITESGKDDSQPEAEQTT